MPRRLPPEICGDIGSFLMLRDWLVFCQALGGGGLAPYISRTSIIRRFLDDARLSLQRVDVQCWCTAEGSGGGDRHLPPSCIFPRAKIVNVRFCSVRCHLLRWLECPLVEELSICFTPQRDEDFRPALLNIMARCPVLQDLSLQLKRGALSNTTILPLDGQCEAAVYLSLPQINSLRSLTWMRPCFLPQPCRCMIWQRNGPSIIRRVSLTEEAGQIFELETWRRAGKLCRSALISPGGTAATFREVMKRPNWNVLPFVFFSLAYLAVETIYASPFPPEEETESLASVARELFPGKEILLIRRPGRPLTRTDVEGPVTVVEFLPTTSMCCTFMLKCFLVRKSDSAPNDLREIVSSLKEIAARGRHVGEIICVLDNETMRLRSGFSRRHRTELSCLPLLDSSFRPRRWLGLPVPTVGFHPTVSNEDVDGFVSDVSMYQWVRTPSPL